MSAACIFTDQSLPVTNDQIYQNDLPDIEQSSFQPHPRRFLKKKLIADFLWTVPLFIGAGVLIYFFPEWWAWGILGLVVVIVLLVLFVAYKGFTYKGYALRERDITYKRGWIFHKQVTVPFNRIQHTEISHGPIDRAFNLRGLDIYTAGGASSDLKISGLAPNDAERIKEYLAKKTAADGTS